jgi:hypothetical protein
VDNDTDPLHLAHQVHHAYAQDLEKARQRYQAGETGVTARDREISRVYAQASRRLAALQKADITQTKAKIDNLHRELFGMPNPTGLNLIAHRDAQDRAAQITDAGEGKRLLARAMRDHDDSLARAIVGHAAEQGWKEVVVTYYADKPDLAAKYEEWAQTVRAERRPDTRFRRSLTYMLPTPTELSKLQPHEIEYIAHDGEAQ